MFNKQNTMPVVLAPQPAGDETGRRIHILMATYNGGRYIEKQIRSIQSQSLKNWSLYIRDDQSRDDTVEKIKKFEQEDERIHLVQITPGNLGAIGNFSALMGLALKEGAEYVFFSDQDDEWHPEKLSIMLAGMHGLEAEYGNGTPLMVHSDLAVVDAQMKTIASSFVDYMRLAPTSAGVGLLLVQNQVTGCASLVNRAAIELACPVPDEVLMHDWWLALLCAATGKIGYIAQPLVYYRQHGSNVIGAESYASRLWKIAFSPKRWQLHLRTIRRSILQAGLVRDRIMTRKMPAHEEAINQIAGYANILSQAPVKRLSVMHAFEIYKPSPSAGLVFKLLLLLLRRPNQPVTNR